MTTLQLSTGTPRAYLHRSVRQSRPPAPVAGGLCAEVLKLRGLVRRSFRAHQVVAASEVLEGVHVVVERGAFAVRTRRRDGTMAVVEVLGSGSCASLRFEGGDAGEEHRTLVALVPTTVLATPVDPFFRALRASASLAAAAADAKARENAFLRRYVGVVRLRRPVRRLAGTVLYLMDVLGEGCPLAAGTRLPLTQAVIASVAHLSRQTVNRELRRLHEARYIYATRGMVCCLDPQGLQAIASGRAEPASAPRPATCKLLHPHEPLDCAPPHQTPRR